MSVLKTAADVASMRKAGRVVALVHEAMRGAIKPGVRLCDLDELAEATVRKEGAIPAFKGLYGFPATVCASVNEEVVHGIPSRRRLEEGDILSLDVGAIVDGFYGDSAWTYPVGSVRPEVAKLLEVAEASLYAGIDQARVGHTLDDLGRAVQGVVEAAGFSVVREYVGHGIGRKLHEAPQIPNYFTGTGHYQLRELEAIAIEPMVNIGGHGTRQKKNGWTVVTVDGTWSAHFEHTVIVTREAPILTTRLDAA